VLGEELGRTAVKEKKIFKVAENMDCEEIKKKFLGKKGQPDQGRHNCKKK